jgi:hypothetical protein
MNLGVIDSRIVDIINFGNEEVKAQRSTVRIILKA